jgi:hypothetical protein
MTVLTSTSTDPWRTLAKATGAFGLVGVALIFTPVIAISGLGEPPFDGTPDEVTDFLGAAGDAGWYEAAGATFGVGMLCLLWFFVGLTALLRRAEGEPAWRSVAALLSAAMLVAYASINASWEAAAYRGAVTDPAVALYAFDVANLGFANAWLSMASFAVGVGWVLHHSKILPLWCAWWAIAVGVGLVLARYVWESPVWLLPYAAFWVAAVALAVRLLRRGQLGVVLDPTERTPR